MDALVEWDWGAAMDERERPGLLEMLDAAARQVGIADVAQADDEQAATASLAAGAAPDVPVLICGSLYLCGRVLARNG